MAKIIYKNLESYFKLSIISKVILMLFAFSIAWGSIETYNAGFETLFFNNIFQKGFFHPKFFNFFHILLVLSLFIFIKNEKLNVLTNSGRLEKWIFIFIILNYVLNMINPNSDPDHPILGMPLFSNVGEYILIFLVLIYISIKAERFLFITQTLFYFISINILVRSVIQLFLVIIGKGSTSYYGFDASLSETDSLYIISFFQALFLSIFLLKRKKVYLIYLLILTSTIILSYRRSPVGIMVISNLLILITYFFYLANLKEKLATIFVIVIISIASFGFNTFNSFVKLRITERLLAAIPGMADKKGEFSDSGHWDQTTTTIDNFFKNPSFWGSGYGTLSDFHVQGQSRSIHNIFVASWAYLGFHQFLFLIFTFIIIIYYFLLNIKTLSKRKGINKELFFLKLCIAYILIGYFIIMFFNSFIFYINIKMSFFWITFLLFLVKVSESSWINYQEAFYYYKKLK